MPLGGVLFKVFIVGEAIKVVKRFSLPNVSKRQLSRTSGVYRFPRVSCAVASADDADLDPNIAGKISNLATYATFPIAILFLFSVLHPFFASIFPFCCRAPSSTFTRETCQRTSSSTGK